MPELAGQGQEIEAPASETPATASPDIEVIRQEALAAANAAAEERIKGFQRILAERDRALADAQRQAEELRLAALPDEDREEEIRRRESAEIDRLKAENELLRLMPEYPDELPVFQRLLAAQDAKSQLELIREIRRGTQAPATGQAPASGNEPAPVDANNPASDSLAGAILSDGTPMSDDLAERLLRSVSRLR